jgi:hypothetical protein
MRSGACGEARRLGGRIVAVYVEPITFACHIAENSAEAVAVAISSIAVGPGFGAAQAQAAGQQARRLQTETTHHDASQGLNLCFADLRGDPAAGLVPIPASSADWRRFTPSSE